MGKHKLTARKIESIKKTGTYADGGNLYLRVQVRNGRISKSWVFRWARDGKVFERGLGALDVRSLAEARTVAAELRKALYHGQHPDELLRRRRTKSKTFADCALELIENKKPAGKTRKPRRSNGSRRSGIMPSRCWATSHRLTSQPTMCLSR